MLSNAFRYGLAAFLGALMAALSFSAFVLSCSLASAQEPPRQALQYRSDLVRIAHAEWGLDAPVAAFAAQVHQESSWNPAAVSRVGAKGMAQFMPATATWWCELHGLAAEQCQPSNPVWSMRALVGYDRWLYQRVSGSSEYDRLWAALRAYNGGLGHWQAESRIAGISTGRESIDAACGKARRHESFCPENLGYPRRIMNLIQPRYASWGRAVLL
jgi:soluble lytic murein transglycosylase-like protein